MLNTTSIKSFTDLRLNPAFLAKQATDVGPVYILHRNKPISVLMDVHQYELLIEELQDSRDSLWLKTNEAKLKKTTGISAGTLKQKYHLDL
jgi:PHD/YefM family antitoxin component YafN of YafNO toxin-antitoxin module